MASRLNITDLDFDTIKTNLTSFLRQQTEFQDYDFEGSGLSVLLDVLAYNTHYNAYYLNMVANEAFLDTALLRDSVVSHAKTLGYIPRSYTAPKATINMTVETGDTTAESLTIPKGYTFSSDMIDGISYKFNVLEDTTVTKSNTQFIFENLDIYEGKLVTYNYTHNSTTNPKSIFVLPDSTIDTTTIYVTVQDNSSNTSTEVYNHVTDILDVGPTSAVYFLQEGRNGFFQIYFGNGTIGKAIADGSTVSVTYLVTNGETANKANGFIFDASISGYSNIDIEIVNVAGGGAGRESVDSIKYASSSQFSTQNRLVTYKDYETYILTNYPNIDSISVWGGEDNDPPVFGKVFASLKPKQNYYISEAEKKRIVEDIISPKSIVSVQAEILDPAYLYLLFDVDIEYDPKKTTNTREQLKTAVRNAILSYVNQNLNTFDSELVHSKLETTIDQSDLRAISGSHLSIRAQKRIEPTLNQSQSYTVKFDIPLHRGTITNKLTSTEFDVVDSRGVTRTVSLDELPQSFSGISSVQVTNPGTNYTSSPTVTIVGDGTGAKAEAKVVNGTIESINITNRGIDYTRATVTISGGGGYGASASAVIDSRIGQLRTVYYDADAQRQVVNNNAGTINYETGVVFISDINILSVNSFDGLLRLTIETESGFVKSAKNTIITLDEDDPTSITVNLTQV